MRPRRYLQNNFLTELDGRFFGRNSSLTYL